MEWNRKFVTQKGNPGVEQPEVDAVTGYIYIRFALIQGILKNWTEHEISKNEKS